MALTPEQEFIHFAKNAFNISLGQLRILQHQLRDESKPLDRNVLIERTLKIQSALDKAVEMIDELKRKQDDKA